MKKTLLVLTVLFFMHLVTHAQRLPAQKNPDEIEFNGYSIRVFKVSNQGYGFDVLQQNVLILHQTINPYTGKLDGIKKKDDAVKTAKWQVMHLPVERNQKQTQVQLIPMEVTGQLHIEFNDNTPSF